MPNRISFAIFHTEKERERASSMSLTTVTTLGKPLFAPFSPSSSPLLLINVLYAYFSFHSVKQHELVVYGREHGHQFWMDIMGHVHWLNLYLRNEDHVRH